MAQLAFVFILLMLSSTGMETERTTAGMERTTAGSAACPSVCRCKADGMLWRTNCADLGLTDIPSDITVVTTYLDLSMNDLAVLPAGSLSKLCSLQELRLAGNGLNNVHKDAVAGLAKLQVLTMQNNHLKHVPSEALKSLHSLRSLRLDANFLSYVPGKSFEGLRSLRHLWLDDNNLTQVPVAALTSLPALQALTLALNHIPHVPHLAFYSLHHLVVLHLHNNQIRSLAGRCFEGLYNLETLDMSSNKLESFPTAIRALPSLRELSLQSNSIKSIPEHAFIGNPSLETINILNNPVQSVGRTTFQRLHQLLTLSLSGTAVVTRFPDLTGTRSLETLTIKGTHISELPRTICDDLPNLRQLELSYNHIISLPYLTNCRNIQKIDLRHNYIHHIQAGTFQMSELSSLDLSFNQLTSLPLGELWGLSYLSLTGNRELRESLLLQLLPRLREAKVPLALQCCVLAPWALQCCVLAPFVHPGKTLPTCPGRIEYRNCCILGESSEPEIRARYHCMEARTPPDPNHSHPGLHQLHQNTSTPWWAQLCIWLIFIPSITLNCLVLMLVSLAAACVVTAGRCLVAVLFCLRLLTALCGVGLVYPTLLDCPGPRAPCCGREEERWALLELLFGLSLAACVVLTMAAVFGNRNVASRDLTPSMTRMQRLLRAGAALVAMVATCSLALLVSISRDVVRGELGHVCHSSPGLKCWGCGTALVILNCFCYALMVASHLFIYCHRDFETCQRPTRVVRDRFVAHAVTLLLTARSLLSAAEALLWFSASTPSPPGPGSPALTPSPPGPGPAAGSPALTPSPPGPGPAAGSPAFLLTALAAVLDPLLCATLCLHLRDARVASRGDRKHLRPIIRHL